MSTSTIAEWAGETLQELCQRWGRESVHLFETVGSTNDAARSLAEEGAPAGTVVVAREQKEGRGRGGREWISPRDAGLYLSMVFRPGRLPNPTLLPLLAGLGLVEALDKDLSDLSPALKWPNDVMAGDRKLGGILSEAAWGEDGIRFLVVGVGLNLEPLPDSADDEVREGATSLREMLEELPSSVELADTVIRGLEAYLPRPPTRLDGPLLKLVDRYDWLRDRRVEVHLPDEDEPLPGTCVGIAPDGALLFRPDRGALRRLSDATVRTASR